MNVKEASAAIDDVAKKLAKPRPKMVSLGFDAGPDVVRMFYALKRLAARGCSRLVPPSTCRAENGYPQAEWCEGCIAAEGLGLDREWFQLQ